MQPEKSTFIVGHNPELFLIMLTMSSDLQKLQWLSAIFVRTILGSTRRMPYAMRMLAREILAALRVSQSIEVAEVR
jgi:hypothetical protein